MNTLTPKKAFSRIGLAFACFFLIQQIIAGTLFAALEMTTPELLNHGASIWLISYLPLYLIAFPIFLLIIKDIPNQELRIATPLKPTPFQIVYIIIACIGITFILNLTVVFLSYLIELLRGTGINNPLADTLNVSSPWISFFFLVIVAPVMEEIIFRRILFNKLIVFGGKIYILFSALMFALFHGNIYQLGYAFVLGLIFAGLTCLTGTIRYSIILHVTINFSFSGIGTIIGHYLGHNGTAIYSFLIMILAFVGCVLSIRWIIKSRKEIVLPPVAVAVDAPRDVLLNGGVLFYIITTLVIVFMSIWFG